MQETIWTCIMKGRKIPSLPRREVPDLRPKHIRMLFDWQKKKPSDRRYSTKMWQATRNQVLAREPICRQCRADGVFTAAEEVDHIEPHRLYKGSFYDLKNLQPLCRPCHFSKSGKGL